MSWDKPNPDGFLYVLRDGRFGQSSLNGYEFQDYEHAEEWMKSRFHKDSSGKSHSSYYVEKCTTKTFWCNCPDCSIRQHIVPDKVIEIVIDHRRRKDAKTS